jgi:RHS repeat-associated protein
VIYRADYRGGSTFDTDLKLWEEDEQGIRTTYSYDSLKRVVSSVKEGISASGSFPAQQAITNSFTLDARGQQLTDSLSAVGVSISSSQQLDLAGRPIRVVETNGLVTTMLYELGGRKVTTTLPSGATEITEYYLDRRLASRTGTAIVNEFHDWRYVSGGGGISPEDDRERTGPDSGRVQIEHLVRYASATSPRYRLEGTDWKNDTNRVEVLDWSLTNKVVQYIGWYDPYNALPDFVRSVTRRTQADLSIAYDFAGRTNAIGVEIPAEGAVENPALTGASQLDPVSTNRVTRFRTYFNQVGGTWYESTTNFTYKEIGSSNITVLGITRQRLNNFASGNIVSETIEIDVDTNITVTTITVDRANKRLTEVTDIAQSLLNATNITVNGLLQWQSTPTVAQPVRLGYDSIGRGVGFTNTLGFSKAKVFNSAAQLASETDFSGITTVYTYHPQNSSGAGQIATAIKNGKVTRYSYTPRGELTRVWGDIPYPEERLYNNYGEMTELRTFRGGAGWNGNTWPASPGSFDRTIWAYQEATGLMTNKTDNANRSVNYTYWQGLLKTRTWARGGTVMTNRYNHLGEIIGIDYSDSVTPDVAYGLNVDDDSQFSRTGKPLITVDGSGTWVHAYDHADRLISSVCTNGLFNGITISNRINGVYGREMVRVSGIPTSLETRFGWDSFGRLNLVTNGLAGVSYGYLANSDLLQTTTSRYNGSAPILTATRSWDFGVRLREIRNVAGNVDVSRHNYVYDAMGRRTAATLEDGSLWSYDYNDRDEVIGGRHLWPDGAPFAGQQYAYSYDNLGNRLNTLTGGDGSGIGQRATAYEVNGLNQYAKRHVPSTEDVIGIANVPAVVSVNGATNWVHERLEYFWRDLPVTNSAGPSWTPVWVTATQGASVTNSSTNYLLTAPTNQVFSYDFDGNLTGDSLWNYVWDGENRLLSVESVTALPDAGRRRVEFAYDHQGRRIAKKSYIRNAGTWQMQSSILFVSDGWQLLGELNATNKSAIRSFSWGPDLSGVEMNLGGVGGLALLIDHGTGEVHYPSYDGMGNIIALVSNDVQISAKYQYGPFGEVIQTSGNYARKNPFRWATKFADEETGLVYFGHRYYSQATGRWISRDPIGESDLLNLYCYVGNRSIGSIDPDGLAHFALDSSAPHVHMDRRGPNGGPAYSLNMSLDSSGSISVDVGPKGNHPYPGKAKATQNWEQSWNNPKFRNGVNNTIDNEMRNIRDAFAAAGHNKQKIAGAVSRQSKLSNLKRWFSAGAKIGRNVAVGAIGFAALAELGSTSARASDSIASYAQNKYIRGDQAQADLDAIDVATQVMEATGNYFYGYAALDGLL